MRTLIVQTYPGANETVFRHYPYWQKSGADHIVGLVTDDEQCLWPTNDVVVAGVNRYVEGKHLPLRLLQSLEAGLDTGADEIVVIEYDVVFFRPLPPAPARGIAMVPTCGPQSGYKSSRAFHCPWQMSRDTALRAFLVGHELLANGENESGMPDYFIGLLAERAGIPVIENHFTRYTQNTIHTPEHLAEAHEAFRTGVHAIHGIKTAENLSFIVSPQR
jgi:hypothetical protein